jgi:hypothetical protein
MGIKSVGNKLEDRFVLLEAKLQELSKNEIQFLNMYVGVVF